MGQADKLLSKRRKAVEMANIELRPEQISEHIRVDARAADLPYVITAELAGDSVPTPGIVRKRGRACIGVEARKTSGSGISTNVGILDGHIL